MLETMTLTTWALWALFTAIFIAIAFPLVNRFDDWLHNRKQAQAINKWVEEELAHDRRDRLAYRLATLRLVKPNRFRT